MRLVLDQGVPRDAADGLSALGHDCTHVGALGMSTAEDQAILEWATIHEALVVTLDSDFHTILAVTQAAGPSVIRLRIQGLNGPAVVDAVRGVLAQFDAELRRGAMVTVKARKITCHRLPVGGD